MLRRKEGQQESEPALGWFPRCPELVYGDLQIEE
jgi:hypothetical protein